MVRVSFILPVYNVEKCVRRAIDSLLAQTMPDFEAIFCRRRLAGSQCRYYFRGGVT